MPVWIYVDERGALNVKLQQRLQMVVYRPEVGIVCINLVDF